MRALRRPLIAAVTAAAAATATALLVPAAPAVAAAPQSEQSTSSSLRSKVTTDGILEHLRALEAIGQANSDNRAAGTSGYDQSAAYVQQRLEAAGYKVTLDPFVFDFFQELAPASLTRTSGGTATIPTSTFTYSGSGDVTGTVVAVDIKLEAPQTSTSGCEATDFTGFPKGAVALVQRGTCTFGTKVANAQAAGASAVIIFNQGNGTGRTDLFVGTLGAPFTIPVVGASFADGRALATGGPTTVRVVTRTISGSKTTNNVLADLVPSGKSGRGKDVVLVGAHLDSVIAGPGINDNGSGSATILEIAEQLAGGSGADKGNGLTNTVRFAWWSAEELGLLGSRAYVDELKATNKAELARIKLNLNFDMVGSPNYARFVYDGDNSAFKVGPGAADGPTGSGEIERVFTDYFKAVGLASGETPFSGRSDYGPFIAPGVDIPAGGLFTGAEGVKTASEVRFFGGKAGIAYDPCYHQFCDSLTGEGRNEATYAGLQDLIGNVNVKALDEMGDAAAHATSHFARRDLAKQPLTDPSAPVTGVATTGGGGGLHDAHDDHEGEAS